MSRIWHVQDAETKFGELLEAALKDGPQVVVRNGKETAVLVPIDQWHTAQKPSGRSIKDLLLTPEARTEELTPSRRAYRRRVPPALE